MTILVNPFRFGFGTEADALFARFTTPPTDVRQILISNLVQSLKTAGVWAKFDALYVMAAADAQAAQRNWKQDLYNLTPVASPTFTVDRGYTGVGTTSALDTSFIPSTAGGLYTLNNASYGVWSRTSIVTTGAEMGTRVAGTTSQTLIQTRIAGDVLPYRINQSANGTSFANNNGSGHFVLRRSASNATSLFRNGAALVNTSVVSDSLSTFSFLIGAFNNTGTPSASSKQLAAAHIGASLLDAEILAFYNALNTYLVAVGAA